MNKARKKPVVIEFQVWWPDDTGKQGTPWHEEWGKVPHGWKVSAVSLDLLIPTLEGEMTAHPGDYIIRGVNGEFYPCKPDIFKKTYDIIDIICDGE